jgi:palmitoyltransferase
VHYYYACTVRPGLVDDLPPQQKDSGTGIRRLLWAKRRNSSFSTRRSGVLTGPGGDGTRIAGVRVTSAEITKCRRCGRLRPEVICINSTDFLFVGADYAREYREHIIVGYVIGVC